jgi:hypothetical protein
MRTIFISSVRHSKTRTNLFGEKITEYDTYEGTIKEICSRKRDKTPKYIIKSTREPVNVILI